MNPQPDHSPTDDIILKTEDVKQQVFKGYKVLATKGTIRVRKTVCKTTSMVKRKKNLQKEDKLMETFGLYLGMEEGSD